MSDVDQKLKALSERLELPSTVTLDELIESFERVRADNIKLRTDIKELTKQGYEYGVKMGFEHVTQYEYVKVSDLMNMSFSEFVERFSSNSH